jgi:hypothetical protein
VASLLFDEGIADLFLMSIFSNIREDTRKSRCTTGIKTGGKFATGSKISTGINDTGGKFCHQFP